RALRSGDARIVDQSLLARVRRAEDATRVLPDPELAELHGERIEEKQAPDQRLPLPEHELQCLGRLKDSDQAGQDAGHPRLGARWDEARGWGLGVEAPVAGSSFRIEDARLS